MALKNRHESIEDYLETILELSKIKQVVRSIDIAQAMNYSKPSISIAMKKLKENGKVVFLNLPLDVIKKRIGDINSRGVVLTGGNTLDDIYAERKPLYEKYADFTVDCANLSVEKCVETIISEILN